MGVSPVSIVSSGDKIGTSPPWEREIVGSTPTHSTIRVDGVKENTSYNTCLDKKRRFISSLLDQRMTSATLKTSIFV
jgi:hypothetical protein